MLRGDQLAVAAVDEAVEKGLREELVSVLPRHAVFLGQGEGFGHRLDRGPEKEIARELDRVGGAGLITEIKDPLAHRLLERSHAALVPLPRLR